MTEDEMIERGKQVFENCHRGVVPMPPTIDPRGFSGQTMKMFNGVWGAIPRLSMREKRLVVLGILMGLARADMLTIHGECALRNGDLDGGELRDVVLMGLPYVGFPSASACMLASEQAIAKTKAAA